MVVCLPSLRYLFFVATDSASLLSLMAQVKAKEQVSVSLAIKHRSLRSNMYAGKRPDPMDFRPVPTGKYRQLAGIHRKKFEKLPVGILLPFLRDFRCFPTGCDGGNLRPGKYPSVYFSFYLLLTGS